MRTVFPRYSCIFCTVCTCASILWFRNWFYSSYEKVKLKSKGILWLGIQFLRSQRRSQRPTIQNNHKETQKATRRQKMTTNDAKWPHKDSRDYKEVQSDHSDTQPQRDAIIYKEIRRDHKKTLNDHRGTKQLQRSTKWPRSEAKQPHGDAKTTKKHKNLFVILFHFASLSVWWSCS